MSRRQVGWMVRLEAALNAAVGALTGVALGVIVAVAVVQTLGGAADVPFTVPVGQLAAYVVVATAGGVVAGLLPGRRAARMDVLEAVATA
jgi:putative ABC transport system permease protein